MRVNSLGMMPVSQTAVYADDRVDKRAGDARAFSRRIGMPVAAEAGFKEASAADTAEGENGVCSAGGRGVLDTTSTCWATVGGTGGLVPYMAAR